MYVLLIAKHNLHCWYFQQQRLCLVYNNADKNFAGNNTNKGVKIECKNE